MAVRVILPGPLRELAGNRAEVVLEGGTGALEGALAELWQACPAVRDRVLTERGEVRPHVAIFVDGESIRWTGGLATPVHDGAEICIFPALSGG